MKELSLYRTHKTAIVDDEDLDRLLKFRWYLCGVKKSTIARRVYNPIDRHISLGSEVINKLESLVDHINRDPFDFRKCNLREATYSQNMMNRSKNKFSTSNYKGVCWDKKNKKWEAKLKFKRHTYHAGRFDTQEKAASAYNKLALEFFKEFACLNRNERGEIL